MGRVLGTGLRLGLGKDLGLSFILLLSRGLLFVSLFLGALPAYATPERAKHLALSAEEKPGPYDKLVSKTLKKIWPVVWVDLSQGGAAPIAGFVKINERKTGKKIEVTVELSDAHGSSRARFVARGKGKSAVKAKIKKGLVRAFKGPIAGLQSDLPELKLIVPSDPANQLLTKSLSRLDRVSVIRLSPSEIVSNEARIQAVKTHDAHWVISVDSKRSKKRAYIIVYSGETGQAAGTASQTNPSLPKAYQAAIEQLSSILAMPNSSANASPVPSVQEGTTPSTPPVSKSSDAWGDDAWGDSTSKKESSKKEPEPVTPTEATPTETTPEDSAEADTSSSEEAAEATIQKRYSMKTAEEKNLSPIALRAGILFINRSLTYTDDINNALAPYSLSGALGLSIAADVFPFLRKEKSFLRSLGARFEADWLLPISSSDPANGGTFPTSAMALRGDLLYLMSVSRFRVGPAIGFQYENFSVNDSDQGVAAAVPSVAYSFLRAGGEAEWRPSDSLAFNLQLGLRLPFSVGEIASSDWFPRSSALGFDARVGGDYVISSPFAIGVEMGMRQFAFTMNPEQGDPKIAGGAVDRTLFGIASLKLRF